MDKNQLIETVKAVQQGCEKSYNALYVEFAKTVYYIALKILDSKEDAEDITQEVFIKVHSDISTLENPETFPAWLKRVTSNKCTDFLRKQKVKVDSDLAELDGISEEFIEDNSLLIPDKYVDNAETSRLIIEVIDKLPLPQRVCIYYYYFEQMTIAQIAEALSAPEGTVKKRLSLARDKIRKELEKLEDEEGIKLYGLPLLLTPVLKMAYDKFDMPESLLSSVWEGIQLKASAQAADVINVEFGSETATKEGVKMGLFGKIASMSLRSKVLSGAGVVAVVVIAGVAIVLGASGGGEVPVVNPHVDETTADTSAVTTSATSAVTTSTTPRATTTEPVVSDTDEVATTEDSPTATEPPTTTATTTRTEPVATTPVQTQAPTPTQPPVVTQPPAPRVSHEPYFNVESNGLITIARDGYYSFWNQESRTGGISSGLVSFELIDGVYHGNARGNPRVHRQTAGDVLDLSSWSGLVITCDTVQFSVEEVEERELREIGIVFRAIGTSSNMREFIIN